MYQLHYVMNLCAARTSLSVLTICSLCIKSRILFAFLLYNKSLFKYFTMSTIPTGTYVIMNAKTQTYLNVLDFQVVPGDVVNSFGNYLGNDVVSLFHVLH